MASKLLLLPLIPALAFGIVEVASRIALPTSAPTTLAPISKPSVVVIEHVAPAPIIRHVAPPTPPEPPTCLTVSA